jgi:nucleotide-binding universal stress UspA family protein
MSTSVKSHTELLDQTAPIVVGVDGSPSSRLALDWAVQEAEAHGNPVQAISTYVIPAMVAASPGYAFDPLDLNELADGYRATLTTQIAGAAKGHPSVRIEPVVVQGPAAQVLIEASPKAAALVVGSRGHGGIVGLMLGSVSQQCVAHAHCPVVVIHPPEESAA